MLLSQTLYYSKQLTTNPFTYFPKFLENKSIQGATLLACLAGIDFNIDKAYSDNLFSLYSGFYIFILIIVIILGGILRGFITLYIPSALLKITGSWLGGKANYSDIRIITGWSDLPPKN